MKSVCLVVQNIYDVDPRVRRKAEALVSSGYTVDVLALRGTNQEKKYTLNGVNVYTVSIGKRRGTVARYALEYAAFFFWVVLRLFTLMPRRRYAVVDVNTLPDFLIFAATPARLIGAKLVLDMHEITPEFYMSKYQASERSALVRALKFLERISFKFADQVITINKPIEDLLVSRGLSREKSTVVMNAVDEDRFLAAVRAVSDQTPSDKFVMMYHGTLTRIYGLDIAVKGFALAQKEMPNAELWILGSGPDEELLRELASRRGVSSKVKLMGQVQPGEIPGWLTKCSAGVLPLRRDAFLDYAFPNKLPEFIVMGKPVLMSRLKSIEHYFSDSALAYFEPNRPEDLAKQMVRLYNDRAIGRELSAKAAQEYADIRWEVMKTRYLKLVDSLSAGKQGPVGKPGQTLEHASVSDRVAAQNVRATTSERSGVIPSSEGAELPAYVLVTPARNEAQFIEQTIKSVVAQTVRPRKWVIVSDGSTDGTDEIVSRYLKAHPWIELVRMPERSESERHFAKKVSAFNAGYAKLGATQYQAIGCLDADISFEPDYFEFLLLALANDAALGLVGTPYRDPLNQMYDYRYVSKEHVTGPCQLFRRECFQAIGGYMGVKSGAIDRIADISARMKGWKTRTFTEKVYLHHRRSGTAQQGLLMAKFKDGVKDYTVGSSPVWELFRTVYQMSRKPLVSGGVMLGAGYIWAALHRIERPVSKEMVAFCRREQMRRLKQLLTDKSGRDEMKASAVVHNG